MKRYFFILGRNPDLSVLELISVFDNRTIPYKICLVSREAGIFELGEKNQISELIKIFGGTVKIGEIMDEIGFSDDYSEFEKILSASNLIKKYLPSIEGKAHFGISIYDVGGDNLYLSKITSQLKTLNIQIKDNLREKGIHAGFVKIKNRFLSSVSVEKNQLINKGMELVILVSKEKLLFGKSLRVQEFSDFSLRDVGRPYRDKKSGIIPPKLARMMINIAQVDRGDILLDPFCGSGTLLQEAVVLGYKHIIGSDISAKAIADTKNNLNWLFGQFQELKREIYDMNLIQADVSNLYSSIKEARIGAIITEPYLGPPLSHKPGINEVKETISNLSRLYLKAFTQFSKILDPDGRVVIIFPCFEISGNLFFLDILQDIRNLGFETHHYKIDNSWSSYLKFIKRGSIIYSSEIKFFQREILSFVKIK